MKDFYVGVSLLFISREKDKLLAELKSYVLKSKTRNDILRDSLAIGKKQNIYNAKQGICTFEYIGIEDIFRIIGPIDEGALLGRMSIWDQTLEDAKLMTLADEQFSFKEIKDFHGEWYLAVPVYYIKNFESLETASTISCYTPIKISNPSLVNEKALKIALSLNFKKKIVKSDFEGLKLKNLQFIGFEDISWIKEDFKRGGAFLHSFKEIDSIDDANELIITEEEINGFFE